MRTRRGQAMMELTAGMLALTLVVSALCLFAAYIVRSLKVQNSLRSSSPQPNVSVRVDDFSERHFVGRHDLNMNEWVDLPSTTIERR